MRPQTRGYSVFEDDHLLKYGLLEVEIEDFNVNKNPDQSSLYPFNIVKAADQMATMIFQIYDWHRPDELIIENTVRGRNRHTQRLLEFIHKAILDECIIRKIKPVYLDPSKWRFILDMKLSKEDKENNKLVAKR